jgi:hypothetical protein
VSFTFSCAPTTAQAVTSNAAAKLKKIVFFMLD